MTTVLLIILTIYYVPGFLIGLMWIGGDEITPWSFRAFVKEWLHHPLQCSKRLMGWTFFAFGMFLITVAAERAKSKKGLNNDRNAL